LLISRDTRADRDKMTMVYKCIQWRLIYREHNTIYELVDRSRLCPNTKDITRCVLSHTPLSSLARCQGPQPGRWPNCPGCRP